MRAKSEVCDMCGSRDVDWVDPDTGKKLPHPHLTPIGIRCHGCSEIDSYRSSELEGKSQAGIRVVLVPDEMVDLEGKLKRNP